MRFVVHPSTGPNELPGYAVFDERGDGYGWFSRVEDARAEADMLNGCAQ